MSSRTLLELENEIREWEIAHNELSLCEIIQQHLVKSVSTAHCSSMSDSHWSGSEKKNWYRLSRLVKLQVPWCSRQTAQTSSAFSLVEIGNSQISASLCPRLRAGWNSKSTMIICCCLMSCQNMKNRCYALIEIQVRQSLQKSVQIMLSASVRLTDSSICPITEKGWSLNRRQYFAVLSVLVFLFYVLFFPIFFLSKKKSHWIFGLQMYDPPGFLVNNSLTETHGSTTHPSH